MQEARYLQQLARFAALFAVTLLLPVLLLAGLGLRSTQAEEFMVDAELEHAANNVATAVYTDLEDSFTRFEDSTIERLESGQSPLTNLTELSPWLRGAFRFDENGQLAAPFLLPTAGPPPEPPLGWREAMDRGRQLEATDPLAAAQAYLSAAEYATHPSHAGTAEYAAARTLLVAGPERDGEAALADVYADYAVVRDSRGFRIGDLATLKRAEVAFDREPAVGAVALQSLAEELLAARWTIGRPGEAAVAKRALDRIEGQVDPDWLGNARIRLDERARQLFWAEALGSELALFSQLAQRAEPNVFQYRAPSGSAAVWSWVRVGDDTYVFSFELQAVHDALQTDIDLAAGLESDISAWLTSSNQARPNALVRRSLGPWLDYLSVTVQPADPDTLSRLKQSRRRRRVLIVFLAVAVAILGVILAARLLSAELENARIKADFAANVSHELRSPITQIRLKGEALQFDLVYDDEDRKAHYDAIVRESERLSRLVDNILDFAAIERGAKTYTLRPEDLGEILRTQLFAARDYIKSQGIDLDVEIESDLPVIWVDREAVGQVITNLLSNAAKYGKDGAWIGVRASVSHSGLELAVSDRGIGINKEDLRQVFEPFFRSEDPNVRKNKGTGIGLNIVRYIVEEHGGTIAATSEPGQGTTFTVTFPLEPPQGTLGA